MKLKIFTFLVALASTFAAFSQNRNLFPTGATGGNCGINGFSSANGGQLPNFQLQIHGTENWIDGEGTNYGISSRFGLTNSVVGIGAGDGIEFRLSDKDFSLTNQEEEGRINILTNRSGLRLAANRNEIFTYKQFSMPSILPLSSFNVNATNANGLLIRVPQVEKYGLGIQMAQEKDIAMQVLDHLGEKFTFQVKSSGATYMKALHIEPLYETNLERVITTGMDPWNPTYFVQADGQVFSKTVKFTNLNDYNEKAILIPGTYGYDIFSVDRSGKLDAGKATFRVFEDNNAIEVQSVYFDEISAPSFTVNGYGIVSAQKYSAKVNNDRNAFEVYSANSNARNFSIKGSGEVYARKYTTTLANIPDYVFEKDYKLMSLSDLKLYISTNKHLPNIPSAKEISANEGQVDLGELNRLLLEKVEEMTLYILQMEERLKSLEEK